MDLEKIRNKGFPFIVRLQLLLSSIGRKKLDLTVGERMLLLGIGQYADNETGNAWPLGNQLEDATGLDKSHHAKLEKKLRERKFITVTKKHSRGEKMTRKYYTINLEVIINFSINDEGLIKDEGSKVSIKNERIAISANDQLAISANAIYKTTKTAELLKSVPKDIVQPVQSLHSQSTVVAIPRDKWFEEFWSCYPRKERKKAAHDVWVREGLDRIAAKIILDVRDRQVRHDRWECRSFVPLPVNYLNNEGWEDEIIERRKLDVSSESRRSSQEATLRAQREYLQSISGGKSG